MNAPVQLRAGDRPRPLTLRSYAGLIVALVVAIVPAAIFYDSYLMGVFASIAIFGIVLVGLDLVIGYGELLAFSHGAFFALGAYVMGILSARYGVPLLAGAAAAILVNAALALLIGIATLRLHGYYLAVATLGFGIIVVELLGAFADITGGWSGLRGIAPVRFFGIRVTEDVQFYAMATAVLILGLGVARRIIDSRFGRAVRASGNDSLSAEMLGIPTARVRLWLFVIGALYASVAGSIYAAYLRVITPANFDVGTSIDMILMLFLGGKETLWGSLIGASILKLLPEFAEGFNDYKTLVQGLLFVLVLMFFPHGLAGLVLRAVGFRRSSAEVATRELPAIGIERVLDLDVLKGDSRLPPTASVGAQSESAPLLRVEALTKRFGGVAAVSDVSFDVSRGQLKAVIGPNGAGKTTLFNLITGALAPDTGSLFFQNVKISAFRPHQIAGLGVARTFQTPRLFSNMSVIENVLVGRHTRLKAGLFRAVIPSRATHLEEQHALRHAERLLTMFGLAYLADEKVDSLAFGQRRLLEIARCLAMEPAVVLLDEPAAGLNETEKDGLARLLRSLRGAGITLVLVEHDMRLVMGVADEIVVLNHGKKIAEATPEAVRKDKAVLDAYLGSEVPHARS